MKNRFAYAVLGLVVSAQVALACSSSESSGPSAAGVVLDLSPRAVADAALDADIVDGGNAPDAVADASIDAPVGETDGGAADATTDAPSNGADGSAPGSDSGTPPIPTTMPSPTGTNDPIEGPDAAITFTPGNSSDSDACAVAPGPARTSGFALGAAFLVGLVLVSRRRRS